MNGVGFKLRGQLACWEAVQCDRLLQLLARVAAAAVFPRVSLPATVDPKGGCMICMDAWHESRDGMRVRT